MTLFHLLGETWKDLNSQSIYVIDSYPIACCDNYRICRSRLYKGEVWRGRQASKKRFFYGLKIHIMVTEQGQPVEFFLTPGVIVMLLPIDSTTLICHNKPGSQQIRHTLIMMLKIRSMKLE